MKNNQHNSNDKTLLGLKKRTLSNKPKEERILETVNRVIHRIQNDEYEEIRLPDMPATTHRSQRRDDHHLRRVSNQ